MPVIGIGGLFFRARDTQGLESWYREMLGVGDGCGQGGAEDGYWHPEPGPVEFNFQTLDCDYFEAEKQVMLNLRVRDMDGVIEQLNARGIEVETREEWDAQGLGRFARIHDPEGNPIELWEPAET